METKRLALPALHPSTINPQPVLRLARHAMATRFEIALPGEDHVRLRAAGEEALDEIERLESQLSFYRASSEISAMNARGGGVRGRGSPALPASPASKQTALGLYPKAAILRSPCTMLYLT